jgi:3-phenylpropionate/trans-cinnamate dioxygenase ferredoxin reductase component
MSVRDVVVVGGGLAAQRFCERLRRAGCDARIRMVCDEPVAPYDRPPLSKQFLAGKMTDPPRLRPDDWYADNAVELLLARRATRLHPGERRLELANGHVLRYDRLLIATGAGARMLPGFGHFENVHVLRTLADAERLRDRLERGARLVVIGAGFIGQEVAATARELGAEVTLVEAMAAPLAHILGERIGGWFADLHRAEGVDVRLGAGVERLHGNGRCERVELADGSVLACDEIVVGVGVAPATGWLAGSGLVRSTGGAGPVEADDAGRTAAPEVYAAGDCAGGLHWEAAGRQATAAALAMLGENVPPLPPPSFWSDLYGTRVNFLGNAGGADGLAVDGDPGARDFSATYSRGGRAVAGLLVGRPQSLPALRRLLDGPANEGEDRWH